MCVYDGPHRLLKDDMMLDQEFEVRTPIPNSKAYVTDLDTATMFRAEAFHEATPEEKGPWIPNNITGAIEAPRTGSFLLPESL